MRVLGFKKLKTSLLVLTVLTGLMFFFVALMGYVSTPFWDSEYEMTRCPDWGFHECYATNLDLTRCGVHIFCGVNAPLDCESSLRVYESYPALIHYSVHYLSKLVLPVYFWLASLITACLVLTSFLLFRHGGKDVGRLMAPAVFLVVIPASLLALTNSLPYTWVDFTVCGLIPFVLVSTLFLLGLFEAEALKLWGLSIVCVLMWFSHNYGFVLVGLLLACLLVSWLLKRDYSLAKYIVLIAVLVWVQVYPFIPGFSGSDRVVYLLYFIVSIELARRIEELL